jgi:hypothetical protein
MSDVEVSTILVGARVFFDHIFSNIVRWDKQLVPFQRAAWFRLYGIPLHTWNEQIFKLCVLDCGRFLRTDCCSMDRERFDYARILIVTSSLEVVNCVEKIVVDGEVVEIRIIEEYGFNIGDDVCLYDNDDGTRSSNSDHDDFGGDAEREAELLVDNLVKDIRMQVRM